MSKAPAGARELILAQQGCSDVILHAARLRTCHGNRYAASSAETPRLFLLCKIFTYFFLSSEPSSLICADAIPNSNLTPTFPSILLSPGRHVP